MRRWWWDYYVSELTLICTVESQWDHHRYCDDTILMIFFATDDWIQNWSWYRRAILIIVDMISVDEGGEGRGNQEIELRWWSSQWCWWLWGWKWHFLEKKVFIPLLSCAYWALLFPWLARSWANMASPQLQPLSLHPLPHHPLPTFLSQQVLICSKQLSSIHQLD